MKESVKKISKIMPRKEVILKRKENIGGRMNRKEKRKEEVIRF